MDQNSTGGSDKRNWRERLGIGTKDNVTMAKDLPKVSTEFKPMSAPEGNAPKTVAAPVRPAPMAPRPAVKPGSARPAAIGQPTPRPAAMAPDALANKLKSQRDAAEKLAEQRVAAAKQRAEAAMPAATNGNVAKPKFSFADDESKPAARPSTAPGQPTTSGRPAPQVQRTAPPPAQQQGYPNQIAPPRPPLGGGQAVPPRPAQNPQTYPPQQYPQGQSTYPQGQTYYPPQPQQYPPGYKPQTYAPVPPPSYRPIDPATGYAPPSYNPQMRPQYAPQGGPRLQVPQRQPVTGFNSPQPGFNADARGNPRLASPPPMRQAPSAGYAESDEDDIFEQPTPRGQRRATADDYNQAYREVETGYEDEAPRSRGPLMLLGVIVLALVAGLLAVWGYTNYVKNGGHLIASQTNVPVVAAPEKPAKTTPDTSTKDNVAAGKATNSSKKLIYDRIVGDHEVPGGQLVPSEEAPVQPAINNAPAAPADGSTATPALAAPDAGATGTGNDGTPLPLPPPPGGTTGTQGSLDPSGKGDAAKTDQAMITPAAGASSAAVPAPTGDGSSTVSAVAGAGAAGSEAIVPKTEALKPAALAPAAPVAPAADAKPVEEAITDTPAEPIIPKEKKLAAKPAEVKKPVAAETPTKSLGAKPVVLVPPSKLALQNSAIAPSNTATTSSPSASSGGGLYGNTEIGTGTTTATAAANPVEQPKKRKSLLDLFKTDSQTSTPTAAALNTAPPAPIQQPVQQVAEAAPKISAPAPISATGAYVAQLASFKSKSEATAEYARLAAKHGAIIKRYAPIIEQAEVAGSTRYRLNIGPMASSDVASSFCSSLFAAGERDCLVHRQ